MVPPGRRAATSPRAISPLAMIIPPVSLLLPRPKGWRDGLKDECQPEAPRAYPAARRRASTCDPVYLPLIDSGSTLSSPETHFWHWRAVTAGTTSVSADPTCRRAVSACRAPSLAGRLDSRPSFPGSGMLVAPGERGEGGIS